MYTDIKLEISFLRVYNILHRQNVHWESWSIIKMKKKTTNFYSALEIHFSNSREQFNHFTKIYMYMYTDDLHILFFQPFYFLFQLVVFWGWELDPLFQTIYIIHFSLAAFFSRCLEDKISLKNIMKYMYKH